MKKKIVVASIVGIILISVIAVYFYIFSSSIVPAQAHIESGEVLINGKISSGMIKLKQKDIIETGENSYASVIIYESIVINLEPNTKISIEDLVKNNIEVYQEKGSTWNTFTKLFGIESYTARTGTSVASVRGTAFSLREEYLLVGEGEVNFKIGEKEISVPEMMAAEKKDGELIKREATSEEIKKIIEGKKRAIKELKVLRNKEIEKNSGLISIAKKRTGIDKQKIIEYLETEIDEGNVNIDDILSQSPLQTESIKKVAELTKTIQKINKDILKL